VDLMEGLARAEAAPALNLYLRRPRTWLVIVGSGCCWAFITKKMNTATWQ
jgi:hypothetical protein